MPFKKGQSGNPKGRAKTPPDVKGAKALTEVEFYRIVNKYLYNPRATLKAASDDPNTPIIELLIGNIIAKAVSGGDERRLNFIMERLLGKVKEQHVHSGIPANTQPTVIILPAKDGKS